MPKSGFQREEERRHERTTRPDYGVEAGRDFERGYEDWRRRAGRIPPTPWEEDEPGAGYGGFGEYRRAMKGGFGYTGGGYYRGERYDTDAAYGGDDYVQREHEGRGDHPGIVERVKRFFGKGPKGYKRSDERIREDVCERLSAGYLDASDIEVAVKDGEVTLTGEVAERRWKRLAEDLAEEVPGVDEVHNRLHVQKQQ